MVAESTRSSPLMLFEPEPESKAPLPVSFAQPSPAPPVLEQGQAVPLPSPLQKELPGPAPVGAAVPCRVPVIVKSALIPVPESTKLNVAVWSECRTTCPVVSTVTDPGWESVARRFLRGR